MSKSSDSSIDLLPIEEDNPKPPKTNKFSLRRTKYVKSYEVIRNIMKGDWIRTIIPDENNRETLVGIMSEANLFLEHPDMIDKIAAFIDGKPITREFFDLCIAPLMWSRVGITSKQTETVDAILSNEPLVLKLNRFVWDKVLASGNTATELSGAFESSFKRLFGSNNTEERSVLKSICEIARGFRISKDLPRMLQSTEAICRLCALSTTKIFDFLSIPDIMLEPRPTTLSTYASLPDEFDIANEIIEYILQNQLILRNVKHKHRNVPGSSDVGTIESIKYVDLDEFRTKQGIEVHTETVEGVYRLIKSRFDLYHSARSLIAEKMIKTDRPCTTTTDVKNWVNGLSSTSTTIKNLSDFLLGRILTAVSIHFGVKTRGASTFNFKIKGFDYNSPSRKAPVVRSGNRNKATNVSNFLSNPIDIYKHMEQLIPKMENDLVDLKRQFSEFEYNNVEVQEYKRRKET